MTSSFISLVGAAAPVLLAEGGPGGIGALLGSPMTMMVVMFAIIYFMVLRPMSKQEKDRKARLGGLKKGDEVVLGGGILGRISNIDGDIAIVEIADRVKIKVLKKDISDTRAAAEAAAKKDDKAGSKKDSKKDDAKDAKSA
jgi:preprotein translocase subunit YajC